ncbi:hypothetical protein ACFQH6_13115 [Halobacteriaceae archaeon GCM10025711]
MSKRTRRRFLAGSAAVALAGCLGDAGDSREPDTTTKTGTIGSVDESARIRGGGHNYWTIDLNGPATVEYEATVTEGAAIDVFLLSDAEYAKYKQDQPFDYSEEGSTLATEHATASLEVTADTYYFLLDNTDRGEAAPKPDFNGGTVVADVTLDVYR